MFMVIFWFLFVVLGTLMFVRWLVVEELRKRYGATHRVPKTVGDIFTVVFSLLFLAGVGLVIYSVVAAWQAIM